MMGVSCMDPQTRADRVRNEMFEHLEKKYGKEFTEILFILRYDSVNNNNRSRLTCYPTGGNPETDRVTVMRTGRNIRDNYFGIFIREEVEAEIERICELLSLDVKVFSIGRSYFDNKYDATKDYSDIKSARYFIRNVRIAVLAEQDNDMEAISEQIFQTLMDEGLAGFYAVFFLTEEGFNTLTRENREDNMTLRSQHAFAHYSRSILPPIIAEVSNGN